MNNKLIESIGNELIDNVIIKSLKEKKPNIIKFLFKLAKETAKIKYKYKLSSFEMLEIFKYTKQVCEEAHQKLYDK